MLYRISVICGLVLLGCSLANAQEQAGLEGFIAGIRANAVKGEVLYQREEGKFPVESGLRLEQGDFIRSSAGAFAELLLQPGNFLRVGGETECQIVTDQYDKMRLKLNNGTLNLEVLSRETNNYSWFQIEQATELIRVITPNAEVFINHPGVFRISTTPAGRTEVVVREGEVVVNGHRIKKKQRGLAVNGNVSVVEIDARVEDDFDTWSRERAAQLVQENKLLKKAAPWAKQIKRGDVEIEVPNEEPVDNRGRVISARPGSVNFVEDGVEFSRYAKAWQPLTEKSQLETGDKLRTAAYSLAEFILLPDMHLRIAGSSEVLLDELSNELISLKVVRGSAILDVARFDRKLGSQIKIGGSSTSAVINETGNYRVDARGNGNTITVREGKVMFNDRSVGSCKILDGAAIFDCDKKPNDNFDFWSQHRGEGELYNGRVTLATVTHLTRLRRYRHRNTGFWYQHPGQTSYTFVPYTSQAFRSPYGGNYSTVLATRSTVNRTDNEKKPRIRSLGPEIMRPNP